PSHGGAGAGRGGRPDGGRRTGGAKKEKTFEVEFKSRNLQYLFQVEYLDKAISQYRQNNKQKEDDPGLGALMNEKLLAAGNNQSMWAEIRLALQRRRDTLRRLPGFCEKSMRVLYPGLLIGTGYPHMTKQVTGEIQLGFSFDTVTGAPCYPGSSVKGVVHQIFTAAAASSEEKDPDKKAKAESCRAYLLELLREVGGPAWKDVSALTSKDVENFAQLSFGDVIEPAKAKHAPAPLARDIFYDACIVGGGGSSKVFGLDNIAPHTDEKALPAPTKDPVPVTFLRILPGAEITFPMVLHDAPLGEVNVSAGVKKELYARILQDFGIGAKTNVGYGALEPLSEKA
ncbi:MAG: type III-B CRISPR module RAMP protein Cmr6, partial [Fretibacterium sp.]|nr:type III-B CRISPR module RAMP protein Cmr6 [Fretibacterium sp.]